jgi:hypothetical protein
VKRGTVGTFVSNAPSPFARRERLRVLRQWIDTLLADASHPQPLALVLGGVAAPVA